LRVLLIHVLTEIMKSKPNDQRGFDTHLAIALARMIV
jgi:hypothetical protein